MSLDKPYMYGNREFHLYNLKSKRWKGLMQVPDEGYFAKKRRDIGLGENNGNGK